MSLLSYFVSSNIYRVGIAHVVVAVDTHFSDNARILRGEWFLLVLNGLAAHLQRHGGRSFEIPNEHAAQGESVNELFWEEQMLKDANLVLNEYQQTRYANVQDIATLLSPMFTHYNVTSLRILWSYQCPSFIERIANVSQFAFVRTQLAPIRAFGRADMP